MERLLLKLRIEANTLADIACNGAYAKLNKQFEILFQACRSCHKSYRKNP
ncbi:MAG TPA: hypothetical protein ENJ01_03140 [Gammaproteobacteria bacterium]|nr:hypothetical protein [Gammaproteobacteria bacterium]